MILISQFARSRPQSHLIMWCYNFHAHHKVSKDLFTRQNVPAICLVEIVLKKKDFRGRGKTIFFCEIQSDLSYFKPTVKDNNTNKKMLLVLQKQKI